MRLSEVRAKARANKYQIYAWLLGMGFIMFAMHNKSQPLIEYAFVPVVGFAISMLAMLMVIYERNKDITLGDKRVWIPLLVIVTGIAVSGFYQMATGELTVKEGIAPLAFGCYLFGAYLVGRLLKEEIFAPFAFAVIVQAISCVVLGIMRGGLRTGGFCGLTNYDMASGFLIFGTVVAAVKHRWWLSAIALVGLAFTGAEEAMVALAILGIVMVARRDWGRRMSLPGGVLAVTVVVVMASGMGASLYKSNIHKMEEMAGFVSGGVNEHVLTNPEDVARVYPRELLTSSGGGIYSVSYDYEWEESLDNIFNWRWTQYKMAVQNFSWVGKGYSITGFDFWTVHNVPFVVVDQVGPFAGVAWLLVTVFCLIKTRWKYAWVAVIALSLFDHYLWTQVAPWWWCLVGVSTASEAKSDLIFRRA